MPAKKMILLLVLFSGAGHGLVLALLGIAEIHPRRSPAEFFTVRLVEGQQEKEAIPKAPPENTPPSSARPFAEKTVSLSGNAGDRYAPYVGQVKKRIMKSWQYPGDLIERDVAGIVVLRFTIDESGKLVNILLEKSSGHETLNRNAITAVNAAAPFSPLPREMGLSRLHIIAQFNYLKAR